MIRILDKNVADKIAAGEVVDRPVSIVKELIENSIDAGSTEITCEIKNGGKTYIRVTDDGAGIPSEDVETAFLRHATSKISVPEDLTKITTLGFRGEALASIAAVTRTTLVTRTAEEKTGTRIMLSGGEVVAKESVGCPAGTTIVVTDLFYNTPARREFLKSDAGETKVITDLISEIAFSNPGIRFVYISNGRTVFSTRAGSDPKELVISIYKQKEYGNLIEVNDSSDGITIKGLVSRPSLSLSSKKGQSYVVNGRVIQSKLLEGALRAGYNERLFEGRHPVAFLYIEIDPDKIDVNIHPNKKEIRFHDEKKIKDRITSAVKKALLSEEAPIRVGDYFRSEEDNEKSKKKDKSEQLDVKQILSTKRAESDDRKESPIDNTNFLHSEVGEKEDLSGYSEGPAGVRVPASGGSPAEPSAEDFDMRPSSVPFDFVDLRVKGSVFDTYIICETTDCFYMIDQHAAQERIFYEELVSAYLKDDTVSQTLLGPVLIDISPASSDIYEEWSLKLLKMGYSLDLFGNDSVRIKEIPYFMTLSEATDFAVDFIDAYTGDVGDEKYGDERNRVVVDKLITRSCKAAIKAHDHLSEEEMKALMDKLSECGNPFSCPHGRPTFIKFTEYEIEKFFKRIQ